MFHRLSNTNNQRGEVAWLLTVVSMVVIGVGLVIGFNISTQEQAAIRTAPQAQEVTPAPSKQLLTEPVDNLPRVCFPFKKDENGKPVRVSDPFCLARLVPVQFTKRTLTTSAIDFLSKLKKTDFVNKVQVSTLDNPFTNLTTPKSDLTDIVNIPPASFSFNGGLCLREDEIQNFDISGWNIYLSPFYVRKYESTTNAGAAEFDTFDATIVDANKLVAQAVDGNIRYTSDTAPTAAQKGNQICNYKKGNPTTVKSSANYPVLFKVPFTYSQLLQKINKPDLKGITDAQGFDTQECSLYLHARRGGQSEGDIWNIAKIKLSEIIGEEAAAVVCPPPVIITPPNPSITITTTPTPSDSPTPSPEPLSCTAQCTSSDTCGTYIDPITGTTEQLGCLDTSDATVTAICDINSGNNCQCAPTKCIGPKGVCSPEELACGKSPATVTLPPPTVTVTPPPPTVTIGLQEQVCAYNALAFVEECLQVDPNSGECVAVGERKVANAFTDAILDPTPNELNRTNKWGASNNLQLANVRPDGTPGFRPASLVPASLFTVYDTNMVGTLATQYKQFQINKNAPLSAINLSSTRKLPTKKLTLREQLSELLTRKDVMFQDLAVLPKDDAKRFDAEQYVNFESPASVRLDYDRENYRILKGGKKVYTCSNSIQDQIDAIDGKPARFNGVKPDVSACVPETPEQKETLDTIYGLNVGCGQNIVYGWTLKKCTFDFDIVLVVDTSSSMNYVVEGTPKIEVAKKQLIEFVNYAKVHYGPNTRISLVTFNKADSYVNGVTSHNDGAHTLATKVLLSDSAATLKLLSTIESKIQLSQTVEGTCIQCGLRTAKSILGTRAESDSTAPVVLVLSDGNPNSFPGGKGSPIVGQPNPGNPFKEIYDLADSIRNDGVTTDQNGGRVIDPKNSIKDDVLLVAFGYGDNQKPEQGELQGLFIETLRAMVSYRRNSAGDFDKTIKPWLYDTDKGADVPPVDVAAMMDTIKDDLSSCAQLQNIASAVEKAKDVDQNGIVNILDLTAVFDNYFAKGVSLKEDINSDGIVNINDAVLVIGSLGTVVTPADKPVTEAPTQPAQ
ncbi:VWA domain-containing protein [Candidatus Woesebacteria bacterium]|nr:VWA domain-containing protein [Candidatus Woesebacteria bacterium]